MGPLTTTQDLLDHQNLSSGKAFHGSCEKMNAKNKILLQKSSGLFFRVIQ